MSIGKYKKSFANSQFIGTCGNGQGKPVNIYYNTYFIIITKISLSWITLEGEFSFPNIAKLKTLKIDIDIYTNKTVIC